MRELWAPVFPLSIAAAIWCCKWLRICAKSLSRPDLSIPLLTYNSCYVTYFVIHKKPQEPKFWFLQLLCFKRFCEHKPIDNTIVYMLIDNEHSRTLFEELYNCTLIGSCKLEYKCKNPWKNRCRRRSASQDSDRLAQEHLCTIKLQWFFPLF